MGREVEVAGSRVMEPDDSVSTDRHQRADAVRNRDLLLSAAPTRLRPGGRRHARGHRAKRARRHRHALSTLPDTDALVEAVYRQRSTSSVSERTSSWGPRADLALAEWMRLFVRHVATKKGMLSRSSRCSLQPSISDQTRACDRGRQ